MPLLNIKTSAVTIPNKDLQIAAFLAQPDSSEQFPAIIVFQEIFGVNAHIREVTTRLAQAGYVAIAPALYQRFAPGFETGYTAADIEIGRHYKSKTTASQLLSDTKAAIVYLQTLPAVQSDRIGTIGFCFGGHVAYLAATLAEIKATASFYGAGITTMTPGGGEPTLSRTCEITGTIYTFFGEQDTSISLQEIAQIEAELQKYQVPHQVFRYPADHGFFCDQRSSYQSRAATDAWQRVLQLFQMTLVR